MEATKEPILESPIAEEKEKKNKLKKLFQDKSSIKKAYLLHEILKKHREI